MFLTTIRVRRARAASLALYLTPKQQADVHQHVVVEVMCHGGVIAIAQPLASSVALLWVEPALAKRRTQLQQLVQSALSVMALAHDEGLAERPLAGARS